MNRLRLLLALAFASALSGCAAVVVGGAATAGAVHDRRSVGTVLDDQTLQIAAVDRIYDERERFRGARIKAVTHNGIVLLVGEVVDAAQQQRAVERVSELAGVRRVIDELQTVPQPSLWRRSADTALTSRIKAGLLDLGVPGFDPSQVNVTTVRGEVYLMGLVTRVEADAVVDDVRRVRGVRRVVRAFEYVDG